MKSETTDTVLFREPRGNCVERSNIRHAAMERCIWMERCIEDGTGAHVHRINAA